MPYLFATHGSHCIKFGKSSQTKVFPSTELEWQPYTRGEKALEKLCGTFLHFISSRTVTSFTFAACSSMQILWSSVEKQRAIRLAMTYTSPNWPALPELCLSLGRFLQKRELVKKPVQKKPRRFYVRITWLHKPLFRNDEDSRCWMYNQRGTVLFRLKIWSGFYVYRLQDELASPSVGFFHWPSTMERKASSQVFNMVEL